MPMDYPPILIMREVKVYGDMYIKKLSFPHYKRIYLTFVSFF
jgi:hypothetical protein